MAVMRCFGRFLRGLVATLVLVAGGTPGLLELVGHAPDEGEPLHHIEAASTRHHADHCQVAWTVGEKFAPLVGLPTLAASLDPVALERPAVVVFRSVLDHRLPTSRAPPLLA